MNRSKAIYTSIVIAFLTTAGCQSAANNGPKSRLNSNGVAGNGNLAPVSGGSTIRGNGKIKGLDANSDISVDDLNPSTINPPVAHATPTQQIVASDENESVDVDTRHHAQVGDIPLEDQNVAGDPNARGIYGIRGANGINTFFGTPQEIQNALASGEAYVPGVVDNRPGHHPVAAAAADDGQNNVVTNPAPEAAAANAAAANPEPDQNPPANVETPASSTPSSFPAPDAAAKPTTGFVALMADDPTWTPGLPIAALDSEKQKAMFTNKLNTDNEPFSDMKSGTVMYHLRSKAESVDASIKKASDAMAERLSDVRLEHNADGSLALHLQFSNLTKKAINVYLAGVPKTDDPRVALLKEAGKAEENHYFKAIYKCVDATQTKVCENAVIYVNRYEKQAAAVTPDPKAKKNVKAKPVVAKEAPMASLFLVHRRAPVRFTIAKEEPGTNENHKNFYSFLRASVYNACLQEKRNKKGDIKAAFEAECPGTQPKAEGAAHVLLQSWAVANGRAAFELDFLNDKWDMSNDLKISGAAVVSQRAQNLMYLDKSPRLFNDITSHVVLNAEDAGGDANITIEYNGSPLEESRFSVSSLGAPTLEAPEAKAVKAKSTAPKTNAAASKKATVAAKQ
jgi:hypothetical protein